MYGNQEKIDELLRDYPIFEYGFLKTEQIEFTEKVRLVCKLECQRYGTSWSCPPAVGTVGECRERCMQYPQALFLSTVHEIKDSMNLTEQLESKREHEKITSQIEERMKAIGLDLYRMSGDSCAICEQCTYPDAPCRFPEKMHPCIESHGIVVANLAEACQMEYYIGEHEQLWFSLLFFR